jgi:diacylglycerol kinase family enzyme
VGLASLPKLNAFLPFLSIDNVIPLESSVSPNFFAVLSPSNNPRLLSLSDVHELSIRSTIDKYKEILIITLSLKLSSLIKATGKPKQRLGIESRSNELILILNPNSQGGATGKNWKLTYEKVKKFLPKPHRIIFTKKANDGTNVTRKLLEQGYCNIAAIGGDGTINEVANGFFNIKLKNRSALDPMKFRPERRLISVNAKSALWIIPSGSRNVFASSLGIMHQDTNAFRRISQMKKRKIDVIGVTIADRNNPTITRSRIVLNAAEMGVGAEIISRSKKVRGKINNRFLSTIAGIVSTLPTYESNECDIIMDGGRKITSNVTMAVVANGKFLGGGFNAAPRAKITDGKLDVVIMKSSGSLKMLQKLVEMKGDSEYLHEEDIIKHRR